MNKKNVAVIGAGPMGLAVAYQLVKDGHDVTVFEADDRVGGMTASFDFGGLDIERYYHFICANDQPHFDMISEMGLDEKLKWTRTKMGYYYQGELFPWGNPIALLKFPKLSFVSKIRYGLHAFLSTKRSDWWKLDKVEASTWIKQWVGNEAYDVMWKSLFDLKFYNFSNNLSAAWIWTRIKRIGNSRYSMMEEKLGYLEGGSEILLIAMKEKIEALGGKVELSSPVQKVKIESGKVVGLEVDGQLHQFDDVVSTVPAPYIPQLIPDLPEKELAQFKQLKNIAVVCIIAKLKKAVTENFWLNINDKRMDIPGIVEYSNLNPLDDHIVYVPYYMPAEHEKYGDSDEKFIEKVKSYLKTINPKLTDDDFIDIHASRYRYAQPICEPGFLETIPPVDLPIEGLYVADTSYYYPEDRGVSEGIRFGKEIAVTVGSK
ncbi:NAD(P)/FAD-dependent oxidoreductase [Vibrio lentus]|uniref:Amine oxidase domain-containing protein n=1 Tax=Vibrio lentus TaxID=136468 RepID=A0AA45AB39_9VIBR|nr:NAD(P)/FAD-dependent oxidoreductase [Vibrio lentus]MCB5361870.1 NAD(P)/FAD-dependent oxidoreductase [Vibrio lentus]MCB5447634.1 NAD(P)/FAD-dependent oxidoreductase [Vibrio lentus]MCB5464260.1 NAD(P)/FAD-dependent oxidoreductase [Vibrio lentus]MCC5485608.1 NAD(P)/FAD-dependent oxidoreductase [Vibrio lentus]MCC5486443.1 NAD(P)/FAD-dependent oxidoreductase [Vibrio lentus]